LFANILWIRGNFRVAIGQTEKEGRVVGVQRDSPAHARGGEDIKACTVSEGKRETQAFFWSNFPRQTHPDATGNLTEERSLSFSTIDRWDPSSNGKGKKGRGNKPSIAVRKTPLCEPFVSKNNHFTKTGSGQT
jgi:hypothetical protein